MEKCKARLWFTFTAEPSFQLSTQAGGPDGGRQPLREVGISHGVTQLRGRGRVWSQMEVEVSQLHEVLPASHGEQLAHPGPFVFKTGVTKAQPPGLSWTRARVRVTLSEEG